MLETTMDGTYTWQQVMFITGGLSYTGYVNAQYVKDVNTVTPSGSGMMTVRKISKHTLIHRVS